MDMALDVIAINFRELLAMCRVHKNLRRIVRKIIPGGAKYRPVTTKFLFFIQNLLDDQIQFEPRIAWIGVCETRVSFLQVGEVLSGIKKSVYVIDPQTCEASRFEEFKEKLVDRVEN